MTSLEDIYALIAEQSGASSERMQPDDDIGLAYGIDGDDFEDLMEFFGEKFKVDLSGYRWYFHHGDEGGLNLGGLLFSPPNQRVTRIPVTPSLLLHAACVGRWDLDYPSHSLPSRRSDLLLNQFILAAIAIGILVIWIARLACT